MKLIHLTFSLLFIILLNACGSKEEGNQSVDFKVWGNCGMCKETIEGALKNQPGIAKAEWNEKSKMISVAYDTAVVNVQDIHKKIAAVGYDTELERGDDKAYTALHECCKYKRKE